MDNSPNAEFAQFKKEHKQFSKSELINILFYFKKKLEKIESLLHIYDNVNTPSSKKRFKKNTEKAEEIKKDSDKKRFPAQILIAVYFVIKKGFVSLVFLSYIFWVRSI